jgi:hypothetical protein
MIMLFRSALILVRFENEKNLFLLIIATITHAGNNPQTINTGIEPAAADKID